MTRSVGENDAYYGAVDPRHVAGAIHRVSFDRDLVNMILFNDRILLTDVTFFNNRTVLEHVREAHDAPSLLEQAIMRGIVVPTVREPVQSFSEIAQYMRRSQLLGSLPPSEMDELAVRYGVAPTDAAFVHWPDRMGDRYLHLHSHRHERAQGRPQRRGTPWPISVGAYARRPASVYSQAL
jgi:hypothetical protein